MVADLNHEHTPTYKQTTAYLIDRGGVVRQVFPMLIHHRPSWKAILNEIDRLGLAAGPKGAGQSQSHPADAD